MRRQVVCQLVPAEVNAAHEPIDAHLLSKDCYAANFNFESFRKLL